MIYLQSSTSNEILLGGGVEWQKKKKLNLFHLTSEAMGMVFKSNCNLFLII